MLRQREQLAMGRARGHLGGLTSPAHAPRGTGAESDLLHQLPQSLSVLMAVVASAAEGAKHRLLDNVRSVHKASWDQHVAFFWAVCSYEDRADDWADVQQRAAGALVLVVNASSAQQRISQRQRRAKLHHRVRLVEAVWQRTPVGHSAFDFVWFLDEDISFQGFNMPQFLQRWRCAFGQAGPPVIAQPTLVNGTRHGQGWPQSHSTYTRCLSRPVRASWSDDPCFLRRTVALRNDWVEQWATLIDARFLAWWFAQDTTKEVIRQQLLLNIDFGADEVWCGAADEWVALRSGAAQRSRPQSQGVREPPQRIPCAVITVPIVHEDTRTQGSSLGPDRIRAGHRLLWKAGLRWPQSLIGKRCMGRVCCHGRNCSDHRWARYTPYPRWQLPTGERALREVRACAATRLRCPNPSLAHAPVSAATQSVGVKTSSISSNEVMSDEMQNCDGLVDLWWKEMEDSWTGGA
jgi:hypothetical protein